jgi:hypothetical protein
MDDGVIRSTVKNPVFLSGDDLCKRWGVSRAVVDQMRKEGDGPRFVQLRRRGRVLYRLGDVLAFEERRTLDRKEPTVLSEGPRARRQAGGSRHGS